MASGDLSVGRAYPNVLVYESASGTRRGLNSNFTTTYDGTWPGVGALRARVIDNQVYVCWTPAVGPTGEEKCRGLISLANLGGNVTDVDIRVRGEDIGFMVWSSNHGVAVDLTGIKLN